MIARTSGRIGLLAVVLFTYPAFAANECYVGYSYMGDDADASITECSRRLPLETSAKTKSEVLLYRGQAYLKKKDLDHALADFDQAVSTDPRNTGAYFQRSLFFRYEQKNPANALADISAAIKVDPVNYAYLSARASMYEEMDKLENATDDYDAALRDNPKGDSIMVARGDVWRRRGDYAKALADYEAALKLDPTYANAIRARAIAHAVMALGPTLEMDEHAPLVPEARFQRVSAAKYGSQTVEVWNLDGKLHHCSLTGSFNEPASAIGRTASGYGLTLSSGQWKFADKTAYPVSVSANATTSLAATARAVDTITVGIPLKQDATFMAGWKHAVRLDVKAAATLIPVDGSSYDILDAIDECWRGASSPVAANPFGAPAEVADPAANPFAAPAEPPSLAPQKLP